MTEPKKGTRVVQDLRVAFVGPRSGTAGAVPRVERRDVAAPESPIQSLLRDVHAKFLGMRDGAVANYIPELSRVDADQFGIALVTADGHLYEVGQARAPFTIQSIAKPLVYGLVLQDHGRDAVLERIGVEPSGDAFNEILFDDRRNRPFNAMVNTGAIVATSLLHGDDAAARLARLLDFFRALGGPPAAIDEAVYRSEAATGHRNRAIAYLELNNGMIAGDIDAHLDLYFRQCAIATSAANLAFIAATLANGGVHPRTGERALAAEHVRDVLSVMTTCGMYDFAGEWELRVGLPAKSGVGGGIMAVLPGQLGIGVFSPRLDEHGNSLRGIRVCEALSDRLKLHLLDHRGRARSAIRRSYRGTDVRSKRLRARAPSLLLDRLGAAIAVVELQGNLFFGNTEQALRSILQMTEARCLILAMRQVSAIDAVAAGLLRELLARLLAAGRIVKFADVPAGVRERLAIDLALCAPDVDGALEYCEDALLRAEAAELASTAVAARLGDFEILAALDAAELSLLAGWLARRTCAAGETIIEEGTAADGLYFLVEGSVDVRVARVGEGSVTRLASIDAGNVFGELALLGGPPRTADVIAATDVTVLELTASDFAALAAEHPEIRAKLVAAVARSLSERLRRANAVIRALTS
jgi:glutaminase